MLMPLLDTNSANVYMQESPDQVANGNTAVSLLMKAFDIKSFPPIEEPLSLMWSHKRGKPYHPRVWISCNVATLPGVWK